MATPRSLRSILRELPMDYWCWAKGEEECDQADDGDDAGWISLHDAAAWGDVAVVEQLLATGADVHARDCTGQTPLHTAVAPPWPAMSESGWADLLRAGHLLAGGAACVKVIDYFLGGRPHDWLIIGICWALTVVPSLLLTRAMESMGRRQTGYRGSLARMGLLLDSVVEMMMFAVLDDQRRVVSRLLDAGADVNATDQDEVTPLHLAACAGWPPWVKRLLDRGAGPNAQDQDGATPLHRAAERGQAEAARVLLTRGVDTGLTDCDGRTALHCAALEGHAEMVALLLNHGADLSARDDDGRTALHAAAQFGHAKAVSLLLAKGADAQARDVFGRDPLYLAAEGQHWEVVELLGGQRVCFQPRL